MNFHCFGNKTNPPIILIHGLLSPWQIWETMIGSFSKDYYVLAIALDGHEEERESEFISLQKEADKIIAYCLDNNLPALYAVCGISLGGAIAMKIFESGKLKLNKLLMDGAPLVAYGKVLTDVMTHNYLDVIHKSQTRDLKTLHNFKKNFLPEKHLGSYLKIADNISDESLRNIIKSLRENQLSTKADTADTDILYLHGTKLNEIFSRKSVKTLRKQYPKLNVVCFKGDSHAYKASFAPDKWLEAVNPFLFRPEEIKVKNVL